MAQYTRQGEQYIAEKAGTDGAFKVTHFVLANIDGLDHTAQPSPDEIMPPQEKIVDERPVTQKGFLNVNQTVYSLVLDSSVGDYEFNWIGLKTDDGRLLSVAYDALQQKLRYEGAQEGNNITRNFVIEFEGAKDAAAITVSAETWQIDYSVRLNQIDENQRLVNRDLFGRSTFISNGLQVNREGENHVIKAGVAYIEGARLFLADDINLGNVIDKAVWIDASLTNDNGKVIGKVGHKLSAIAVSENDYKTTENHYLVKVATVDYNGVVNDLRLVFNEQGFEQGGITEGLKSFALNEVEKLKNAISSMFAGQIATFPGTKAPDGWLKSNGGEHSRLAYPYLWAYAQASGNLAATQADKLPGQFGPGDGVSTFTVPDVRGQHPRFLDDGRGIDEGRAIGSEQEDAILEHSHGASSKSAGSHSHTASSKSAGSHGHAASSDESGSHSHVSNGVRTRENSSNFFGGTNLTIGSVGKQFAGTVTSLAAGLHSHIINIVRGGAHDHEITVNSGGSHKHDVSVENTGIKENRVNNVALMACIKY